MLCLPGQFSFVVVRVKEGGETQLSLCLPELQRAKLGHLVAVDLAQMKFVSLQVTSSAVPLCT